MLCYRDKTYCIADCTATCIDRLTPTISKAAMQFGLPVAVNNMAVGCVDFKQERDSNEIKKKD